MKSKDFEIRTPFLRVGDPLVRAPYLILTPAQQFQVGKRAAEVGVTGGNH